MTDTELINALRSDVVFEVVDRGGHWRAFYRVPELHFDIPELPGGCTYRSVRASTARRAIEDAYRMWAAEQTKHRLTK
jgi:hypothetical protein